MPEVYGLVPATVCIQDRTVERRSSRNRLFFCFHPHGGQSRIRVRDVNAAECQSAPNIHPFYLSNFDPPVCDQRLACPALAGVAQGRPSAGDGYLRL